MKHFKILILFFTLFVLVGCNLITEKDKEKDDPKEVEITQKDLQEILNKTEYDVDYPYSFDYFIKNLLGSLENIEEYQFERLDEKDLTVGENTIEVRITYPDNTSKIHTFTIKVSELDNSYDTDSYEFDRETQTILSYTKDGGHDLVVPAFIDGVAVLRIGDSAFKGSAVRSLYLPDTIIEIGSYAFEYVRDLESIRLPRNIQKIGEFALANASITEIWLPATAVSFGNFVFHGNPIEKVELAEDVNLDAILKSWNRLGLPAKCIPNVKLEQHIYYLEKNMTIYGVDDYRHYVSQDRFREATEELGIQRINDYLFYGDIRLGYRGANDYNFGSTIKSIGSYAFHNAQTSGVDLKEGLIEIEEYAFHGAEIGLVSIPDSLTTIQDRAFENTTVSRVEFVNNETRFNNRWVEIGFPSHLKPVERDFKVPEWILAGENDDFIVQTIRVGNTVYAIGYTWSKEKDFANNSPAVVVPFLLSYDLATSKHKLVLLTKEEESGLTSFVLQNNQTFLAVGYVSNDGKIQPYMMQFDLDLNVISEKVVNDPTLRIINQVAINDLNQIAIVSENINWHTYEFIIYDEYFKVLYRYPYPGTGERWVAHGLTTHGNDFVFYGSILDDNRQGFVRRVNTSGVVFDYETTVGKYYFVEHLLVLDDSYFVVSYDEHGPTLAVYQQLGFDGNAFGPDVLFETLGYSFIPFAGVVEDRIVIIARENIWSDNSIIYTYDKQMNLLSEQFFSNTMLVYPSFHVYDGNYYMFVNSGDKYFHNGANPDRLNILVLKYDLS